MNETAELQNNEEHSQIELSSTKNKMIYSLYLANLVIPILGLVGVIMAHLNPPYSPNNP